jgi:hypothetical protein
MKKLLIVTAILECGTGLMLLAFPGLISGLLLGSSLDMPVALTVARVAGVAILSLAVACWFSRNDPGSPAAKGLLIALVAYNTAIALVLVYASLALTLSGIGFWPVVVFHLAMTAWCIKCLLK